MSLGAWRDYGIGDVDEMGKFPRSAVE